MRNHEIAVAWIHIVVGTFVLVCVSVLWWSIAGIGSSVKLGWISELVGAFAKPIGIVLFVLAGAEVTGAIGLLREQGWGRGVLLGISVLEIFIFPIGTAVAAYTYWALMRRS